MDYGAALTALADPTRRAIVEKLSARAHSVGELAEGFPISRPAVSQHLKVLSDAGLLVVTSEGTKRLYRVEPSAVAELRAWLDRLWDDALAAFAQEAKGEGDAP